MSAPWTPGPWVASEHPDHNISITAADAAFVAEVPRWVSATWGNRHANARLIAVAPELAEAAIEFCRKVEAGEARSTKSYAAFKAALRKAGCE